MEWGHIADQDFEILAGKLERLAGLAQEKNGYNKEKAERGVANILKKLNRRPANGNHAFRLLAVCAGALLTIALFQVLAKRRQASA